MIYTIWADGEILYRSDFNDPAYMVLNPKLDEELNKAATLEFTMLPDHILYDKLHPMRSVIRLDAGNKEIFKGRVISYETDIFGQRTVTCEDALSYLLDSIFIPNGAAAKKNTNTSSNLTPMSDTASESGNSNTVTGYLSKLWNNAKTTVTDAYNIISNGGSLSDVAENWISGYYSSQSSGGSSGGGGSGDDSQPKETMVEFFSRIFISHNSQVEEYKQIWPGDITLDDANKKKQYGSESIADTRSVIDNVLISEYGGFLRLRYVDDVAILDYLKEADSTSTQDISLGVNLESINYTEDTANVFSVLFPLGKDNGTIAKANGGSFFLENQEFIEKYGRIVRVKQWSDLTKAADVKEMGEKYMAKHCSGVPVTMDVKAIDMSILSPDVDDIRIGDNVRVIAPSRGIDVVKMVTKASRDLQNPQNDTFTIGDFDSAKDDSTAAYHNNDYRLTDLLGEVEKSGEITRDGLKFNITGLFQVVADQIRLSAENVAPLYQENVDYKAGQYVLYNNMLFQFTEDISKEDNKDWKDVSGIVKHSTYSEGILLLESLLEEHHTQQLKIIADVAELYVNEEKSEAALVRLQKSIAEEYSDISSKPYGKGQYVMRDGEMYVCLDSTTGGNWQPSKWQRTDAGNGFMAVNGTIYAVKGELESLIASEISAVTADVTWLTGKRIDVAHVTTGSLTVSGNVTFNSSVNVGLGLSAISIDADIIRQGGYKVATEQWVEDQGYLKYVNWSAVQGKPDFNIYTIADKTGTLFRVYGP